MIHLEHASQLNWGTDEPQTYRCSWRDGMRTVRYNGNCASCGRRTYGCDDGEDDPRGVLGDRAACNMDAAEHGVTGGGTVTACFLCMNDADRYQQLLDVARAQTKRLGT